MKIQTLLLVAIMAVTLNSCNKDYASDWVGTYTGTAGSNVNRIVVSKVDNNTIKMELQTTGLFTGYVTFATVAKGGVNKSSDVAINEDGSIAGFTDVYHFTGAGSLSGATLTLNGQAQSKTNSSDIKYYSFTGSR